MGTLERVPFMAAASSCAMRCLSWCAVDFARPGVFGSLMCARQPGARPREVPVRSSRAAGARQEWLLGAEAIQTQLSRMRLLYMSRVTCQVAFL